MKGLGSIAITAVGTCILGSLCVASANVTKTLTGHINPDQVYSFVYVPFDVPEGTTSISVIQGYSNKGAGNALDLGVFDPRGYSDPEGLGFRGWSGGYRNNFTVSKQQKRWVPRLQAAHAQYR
jgi:hypothetical protein